MIRLDCGNVEIGKFPDGTLLMKSNIDWDEVIETSTAIRWHFENNEEMVSLMFLTKYLRSQGITDIILEMPYIPNARMDRVKSDNDVFTLKYFAEFINSLGFSKVIVLDPHSYVSEALINNIHVISPKPMIDWVISKINDPNLVMFYPDEGAMKRYSGLINAPYNFGIKKRDWQTGKILGLDVAGNCPIEGRNVLIIDDICSKGGTFYYAAEKLHELGAKAIYLYVTHCENTIFDGKLLTEGFVNHIFTTNSIFTRVNESPMIEVYEL